MNGARLKQFAISLLAVLSLFASSAAACACSHHQEKAKTETPSCHEHSPEIKTGETDDDDTSRSIETTVSEAGCVCLQIAPKFVAKSENIKIKKHVASVQFANPIKVVFVPQIIFAISDFSKPLYLSDSFYNLSPGRAPPVL